MYRAQKTQTELKSGSEKIGNGRIFANEIEDRLGSFKLESGALREREKSRSGHVWFPQTFLDAHWRAEVPRS